MTGMLLSAHGNRVATPALSERELSHLAYRDAMRAIARDVPTPKVFARRMPLDLVEILMTAQFAEGAGWVDSRYRPELLSYGLGDAASGRRCWLTAFGMMVLRELREADA